MAAVGGHNQWTSGAAQTVVIKNKDNSNEVICAYIGCTAQNYSLETRANTTLSETMNMTYLRASLVDK